MHIWISISINKQRVMQTNEQRNPNIHTHRKTDRQICLSLAIPPPSLFIKVVCSTSSTGQFLPPVDTDTFIHSEFHYYLLFQLLPSVTITLTLSSSTISVTIIINYKDHCHYFLQSLSFSATLITSSLTVTILHCQTSLPLSFTVDIIITTFQSRQYYQYHSMLLS